MSMHTEWDVARTAELSLLDEQEAYDNLQPDAEIDYSHVLVIGGSGGGCMALEGSLSDIETVGRRIMTKALRAMVDHKEEELRRAREDDAHPEEIADLAQQARAMRDRLDALGAV